MNRPLRMGGKSICNSGPMRRPDLTANVTGAASINGSSAARDLLEYRLPLV
jgi:hypothetical protein